jgi:hypothetical protein
MRAEEYMLEQERIRADLEARVEAERKEREAQIEAYRLE